MSSVEELDDKVLEVLFVILYYFVAVVDQEHDVVEFNQVDEVFEVVYVQPHALENQVHETLVALPLARVYLVSTVSEVIAVTAILDCLLPDYLLAGALLASDEN